MIGQQVSAGKFGNQERIVMEIYLMQHGQALAEEIDPERRLSPKGEDQIRVTTRALQKMGVGFDFIASSPKKRARQTAEIVATGLGYPVDAIRVTETLEPKASSEETLAFVRTYEDKKRVLLAGHLPSLGEIASGLLSQGAKVSIDFQMGGVCRIDVDLSRGEPGELKWYVTPEQLRLMDQ